MMLAIFNIKYLISTFTRNYQLNNKGCWSHFLRAAKRHDEGQKKLEKAFVVITFDKNQTLD